MFQNFELKSFATPHSGWFVRRFQSIAWYRSGCFSHVVWQSLSVGGWHWCQTFALTHYQHLWYSQGQGEKEHKHRRTKLFFPRKTPSCVWRTRRTSVMLRQQLSAEEMLPFESAGAEIDRIYGELIHTQPVWSYHKPFLALLHLSFCSEKTFPPACVAAGMLGLCVSMCECINKCLCSCLTAAAAAKKKTNSQAVCLWCPPIMAPSDHFITSAQFYLNVGAHVQVGTHVCVANKWVILQAFWNTRYLKYIGIFNSKYGFSLS